MIPNNEKIVSDNSIELDKFIWIRKRTKCLVSYEGCITSYRRSAEEILLKSKYKAKFNKH
jgi:hypothetical protein